MYWNEAELPTITLYTRAAMLLLKVFPLTQ